MRSLAKIRNLEQFCEKAVTMVKSNFENVLQKGVAIEKQMSSFEERSNKRSSGSESFNSNHRAALNLNINKSGAIKSPLTGDVLLFVL